MRTSRIVAMVALMGWSLAPSARAQEHEKPAAPPSAEAGQGSHAPSTPTPAGQAHSDSAAEHGQNYNLMTVDAASAIWTIVIFLAMVGILRKFAWNPIQQAVQQRERFVNESLAKARQEREEAERVLRQYTEQINRARGEASAIVAEGRRDAEEVRRRIEEEAKKEAQATLDRAKREIHVAAETALKQLYEQAAGLSTQIASRLIKKEISAEVHRQLIRESIEELGKVGNN